MDTIIFRNLTVRKQGLKSVYYTPPMRCLRSTISFCLLYLLWAPVFLYSELLGSELTETKSTLAKPITEAKSELFNTKLGDSDVSLFLSGSWKASLLSSWGITLTPLASQAISDSGPLLFTQETDMTLSLWLREKWFLEASFLDDYDLNTYRVGYQGAEDELVQYVGIGNTALDFPKFPYLDLGGDAPNSFGVYGRFGSGPLMFHTMARYDGAVQVERNFQGDRERTVDDRAVEFMVHGRSFVLPDRDINTSPVLYIPSVDGEFYDSEGGRWRKATAEEYTVSATLGLLELTMEPQALLAVSYSKSGSSNPWETSLGQYGSSTQSGTGFLGKTQDLFLTAQGEEKELRGYPQPGQRDPTLLGKNTNVPATVMINKTPCLVIYERGTFSPFERMSLYEAPSKRVHSVELVKASTGEAIEGYSLEPLERDETVIYELLALSTDFDRRSPLARMPLAPLSPGIYLPEGELRTEDLILRFTSYGESTSFNIGADVVPGSVEVYRNGFLDTMASYDSQTGTLSFQSPVSSGEHIRIVYLQRADERRFGSIAAGLGAVYEDTGPWNGALGIGIRWSQNSESYSTTDQNNPGMVGIGGRIGWNTENSNVKLDGALIYDDYDSTDLYRASGMEEAETEFTIDAAQAQSCEDPRSFINHPDIPFSPTKTSRAPLVYRNYYHTDVLGTTTLKPIEWKGAPVVSEKEGPYPLWDESIKSQVLASEFSLDEEHSWTAFQVPLGDMASNLQRAKIFRIPLLFHDLSLDTDAGIEIWLQLGALSDMDTASFESPSLVLTRRIYPLIPGESIPEGYSLRSINLSDEDRRKLGESPSMRLLFFRTGSGTVRASIITSPPFSSGATFRAMALDSRGVPTTAPDEVDHGAALVEERDISLQTAYPDLIRRLHVDGASQRVLLLSWEAPVGSTIGLDGRIPQLPLSRYTSLSFFIRGPKAKESAQQDELEKARLHFIVGQGPDSMQSDRKGQEIALEASIPGTAFESGAWTKVELQYQGNEKAIYVGGKRIQDATILFRNLKTNQYGEGSGNTSTYMALYLEHPAVHPLPSGSLSVDEICLEDSVPFYRGNTALRVSYTKPGTLLEFKGIEVLKDLSIEGAMDGSVYDASPAFDVSGRLSLSTNVVNSRLKTNMGITRAASDFAWYGDHEIKIPLESILLSEVFSFAPSTEQLSHSVEATVSGIIDFNLGAKVEQDQDVINRQWDTSIQHDGFFTAGGILNARWTEHDELPEALSYTEAWGQSCEPLLPDWGQAAHERSADMELRAGIQYKPIGLILRTSGKSSFKDRYQSVSSESRVGIDLPFAWGSIGGSLNSERFFLQTLLTPSGDIRSDGSFFSESLTDSHILWRQQPWYPLLDQNLKQRFLEVLSASEGDKERESAEFGEKAAINLQQPFLDSPYALLIPISFQGSLERRIQKILDTPTDDLSLRAGLGFSAINLFGAYGLKPLFLFYQSDEINHYLETSVLFHDLSEKEWNFKAGQNLNFYGFMGSQLELDHTFTLSKDGWMDGVQVIWTLSTEKTLLGRIYDGGMVFLKGNSSWPALQNLRQSPAQKLLRERLELSLDHRKEPLISLSLGHESIVRIVGRLSLTVFADLAVQQDPDMEKTTILATVGTSFHITY